ncbi:ASP1; AA-AT, partial [Ectocarpus sp. CCAP 1310/34]
VLVTTLTIAAAAVVLSSVATAVMMLYAGWATTESRSYWTL